jgi:D-lyxose ketol-isomerase
LSQALFDLAAVQVEDNTSDVNVTLDQIQTTDEGGGIEFFSVRNRSTEEVNLQGFTLRVLDPETAQVTPGAPGLTIDDDIRVEPGESVSVGRAEDIVDADGERVGGTFEGGTELDLAPGDQVALLDPGGAVASTITV